jgi:hypothetical protein
MTLAMMDRDVNYFLPEGSGFDCEGNDCVIWNRTWSVPVVLDHHRESTRESGARHRLRAWADSSTGSDFCDFLPSRAVAVRGGRVRDDGCHDDAESGISSETKADDAMTRAQPKDLPLA